MNPLYPKTRIDIAVENLVTACGFDRSEGASEEFYYMLQAVLQSLDGEIEQSHKEGLAVDMTHIISSELQKCVDDKQGKWN